MGSPEWRNGCPHRSKSHWKTIGSIGSGGAVRHLFFKPPKSHQRKYTIWKCSCSCPSFFKKNSNPNRKFKDSKLFYNQAYQKNYESEPQICGPEKTNTQPIQKLKQSRSEKIQIRTENLSGSQKMKMGPKRKHMDPDHEFNYPKNFETDSN